MIIGETIAPDHFTNIKMVPSKETVLEPKDSETNNSIENSLKKASLVSTIENNSPLVGIVSLIVSTDPSFFPLNLDELVDISDYAECIELCDFKDNDETFNNILLALSLPYECSSLIDEQECLNINSCQWSSDTCIDDPIYLETNIGLLSPSNIEKIEYTPMSGTNPEVKFLKFYNIENDYLLISRLASIDLPYPTLDENGNVLEPGTIENATTVMDPSQISIVNYTSSDRERYVNSLITLINSHYPNNDPSNESGEVNILSTDFIKIQSYISFTIDPGAY